MEIFFFFLSIVIKYERNGITLQELTKNDKVYFDVGSNQIRDELIFSQIKGLSDSFRSRIKLFD